MAMNDVMHPDIPRETRLAVVLRARGRCEGCDQIAPLELHHLRYEEIGHHGPESIRGREKPADLLALCRECHKARHIDPADDWWNDPEEMANYWESYWNESNKE